MEAVELILFGFVLQIVNFIFNRAENLRYQFLQKYTIECEQPAEKVSV